MELTLTLKEIAIMAIAISIVVFFAYCTALVKNLIITVKRTNYILEDSMKVSKIVADRSEDVDKSISKIINIIIDAIHTSKANEASSVHTPDDRVSTQKSQNSPSKKSN